ncbi:MAG: transcriptional repressor [Bacteroidaceae bacterium]|jgi:Fur family ferric uptake transcriptional regulator|nr:transcriptional repressor [Bacteroidaceae bacterium]MBO5933238.1 transcriptional repressor [Bacteroidaceae bacterium]MBO5951783.1 transcriptional repressor [Bacteroidaceae bacterium]MBQ5573797.1 transcriptional repressor [Bacteroidaceae bacterium]MBR4303500.1 transcriptional repressor [Bacteroidaceae bacterium]
METESQYKVFKDKFADFLKYKALRNTPERFAILEAIYKTEGHFTPETLLESIVNKQNFRLSRATVYNNLELILEAGLIKKHLFTDGVRYEKCVEPEMHHHLICTVCGKVVESKDEKVKTEIENMRIKKFTMTGYALYIYGLCSKCAAAQKRRQKKLMNKTK